MGSVLGASPNARFPSRLHPMARLAERLVVLPLAATARPERQDVVQLRKGARRAIEAHRAEHLVDYLVLVPVVRDRDTEGVAPEHRTAESVLEFDTDLLILDPPRSGCHPSLLKLLEQTAPAKELFYVSCNPHRLAEELDQIQSRYELLRARAFDFFPQTHHAEMLLHFKLR